MIRKILVPVLALLFPLSFSYAAETSLDDVPMAVANKVHPNLVFVLDDSGSMQFEVLPESDNIFLTFPRPNSSNSQGTALYGSTYYSYGTFDATATFDISNKYARCYRNSACNKLYYDPNKLYRPWASSDASLMTNATPTAARFNPVSSSEGTFDLTANQTYTRQWVADNGGHSSYSLTFYPATYFKYIGAGLAPASVGSANNLAANFQKIEIKPGNAPFTKVAGGARTDCAAESFCTYSEEIQNFANWFSFYRSRILAARGGVGRAFSLQGENMRVGFGAINKGSASIDSVSTKTLISGVRGFSGSGRTGFFSNLYGHAMPASGTPLRRALADVGGYFSRTDDTGPWGEYPGTGGGTQFTCRQSYAILMTDGYWNGDEAPSSINSSNIDNTAGSTISTGSPLPPNMQEATSFTYAPGNPYSDSYSGTLADVAMYYWKNDLRGLANRVPPNSRDPAFWQHMSTFTVGFGVSGSISKADLDSAFTSSPNSITWPNPTSGDAQKIDDLAHAAVNGRGAFFSAADPDTFASSMTDMLNDIASREGSAAAVAVANAFISDGENTSYQSSYNPGNWSGDLVGYEINISTGDVDTTKPIWGKTADDKVKGAQYYLEQKTSATRHIASYSGSSGIQFQPANATSVTKLSSAQQTRLNTPLASDGADVVAYLRGDRSKEGTSYRSRAKLLGDIINAEPLVLRPPRYSYADAGYAAYVTDKATRANIVVQGANDGMVHVFRASPTTVDANGGQEDWAYVPKLLIDMNDPNNAGTSVLNVLSRKSGFEHRYMVDATPVFGDVDFSETAGVTGNPDPDWRTIIVGGLAKGGRGIYALDLTSPLVSGATDSAKEANAAGKVLWEFPNAATDATVKANIGFIYGRPIITKTSANGWVVIVASGYNNGTGAGSSGGDGKGYLFVLNARTGALIKAISTGVGTATSPSGLAHVAGYAEDAQHDNLVTEVYGGDLLGNVWRFSLNGNSNGWSAAKLAILRDSSGATQPVTSEPELASIKDGSLYRRFVYVGTGKYLSTDDVGTTQTQSMYGLVDNMTSSPLIPDPTRDSLQEQTLSSPSGNQRTASSEEIDFSTKRGWYVDLTVSKERIFTNPALAVGALIFTSNIPDGSDPCRPGGSSWFNVLDYKTGGKLTYSTVDWSSFYVGDTLSSRPVIVKLEGTGMIKGLVRKTDGSTVSALVPVPPTATSGRRTSWREITQ